MSTPRFLRNPLARVKFMELDPMIRQTFFNGFKNGVLQTLRDREPSDIDAVLTQLDADYDEVMAVRTNAPKPGAGESA